MKFHIHLYLQDTWEEVAAAAAQLEQSGAVVYATTLSNDPIVQELETYAGSKDRVYLRSRVEELKREIGSVSYLQVYDFCFD